MNLIKTHLYSKSTEQHFSFCYSSFWYFSLYPNFIQDMFILHLRIVYKI